MKPKIKAYQIKRHFAIHKNDKTNEEQALSARAYINQILNDIPMLSGEYTMAYEHEWWQYTSYWFEVLKEV